MSRTPMFPLGVVHFPYVALPLQVFEPRYKQLTIDCLDGDRCFGVVLIERGSEVGGGDTRFDVGTMTEIIDAGFNDMGLVRLDTIGTQRIRITEWLPDEPYPQAMVQTIEEEPVTSADLEPVDTKVRQALAIRGELRIPTVPADVRLDPDPNRAAFQLAAIAPLGPADKQRMLAAGLHDMLSLLEALMDEEMVVLASRLAGN